MLAPYSSLISTFMAATAQVAKSNSSPATPPRAPVRFAVVLLMLYLTLVPTPIVADVKVGSTVPPPTGCRLSTLQQLSELQHILPQIANVELRAQIVKKVADRGASDFLEPSSCATSDRSSLASNPGTYVSSAPGVIIPQIPSTRSAIIAQIEALAAAFYSKDHPRQRIRIDGCTLTANTWLTANNQSVTLDMSKVQVVGGAPRGESYRFWGLNAASVGVYVGENEAHVRNATTVRMLRIGVNDANLDEFVNLVQAAANMCK